MNDKPDKVSNVLDTIERATTPLLRILQKLMALSVVGFLALYLITGDDFWPTVATPMAVMVFLSLVSD